MRTRCGEGRGGQVIGLVGARGGHAALRRVGERCVAAMNNPGGSARQAVLSGAAWVYSAATPVRSNGNCICLRPAVHWRATGWCRPPPASPRGNGATLRTAPQQSHTRRYCTAWPDGWMAGWPDGWMAGYLDGWIARKVDS